MIDLDKQLHQKMKQDTADREALARKNRAETIEQEMQLKKFGNNKKVSKKKF